MTELKYFLTAIMFYTRIPVPKWVGYSDEQLNASTKYFPLVGAVVGGLGALFVWGALQFLPLQLAVLLSILFTIWVTGAFHEDGFADYCDGFGGGYTKDMILTIMKDSRLGTYGSIGLVGMLATKFYCLQALEAHQIPLILIAGHVLSRVSPVFLIYSSSYVREDASSKVKPVGKQIKVGELLLAIAFALPLLFLIGLKMAIVFSLVSIVLFFLFRFYIHKKTGGYTGDMLGALQQLSEVVFYIVAVAMAFNANNSDTIQSLFQWN